jgi:hypothetical protein
MLTKPVILIIINTHSQHEHKDMNLLNNTAKITLTSLTSIALRDDAKIPSADHLLSVALYPVFKENDHNITDTSVGKAKLTIIVNGVGTEVVEKELIVAGNGLPDINLASYILQLSCEEFTSRKSIHELSAAHPESRFRLDTVEMTLTFSY